MDHSQSNKTGLKTLRALDPSPRGMSKVIQVYFRKIYFFHIWHQIMNKWRLYFHWETSDWIFVKSSIKERYNHNLICDKIFNTNIYPNFQDGIELRSSFLERYPKMAVWHCPWRRAKGLENLWTIVNPIKRGSKLSEPLTLLQGGCPRSFKYIVENSIFFTFGIKKWINGGYFMFFGKLRLDISEVKYLIKV